MEKNVEGLKRYRPSVMLSGALQRNVNHEARLSNISDHPLAADDHT